MKKAMIGVSGEQSDRRNLHSVATYSQIWLSICGVSQIYLLSHWELRDWVKDIIVCLVNAVLVVANNNDEET